MAPEAHVSIRRRYLWLSPSLALIAIVIWATLHAGLLEEPFLSLAFLLAGPLAFASLVIGIAFAALKARPRWLPLLGIAMAVGALTYIAYWLLRIMAVVRIV